MVNSMINMYFVDLFNVSMGLLCHSSENWNPDAFSSNLRLSPMIMVLVGLFSLEPIIHLHHAEKGIKMSDSLHAY